MVMGVINTEYQCQFTMVGEVIFGAYKLLKLLDLLGSNCNLRSFAYVLDVH